MIVLVLQGVYHCSFVVKQPLDLSEVVFLYFGSLDEIAKSARMMLLFDECPEVVLPCQLYSNV